MIDHDMEIKNIRIDDEVNEIKNNKILLEEINKVSYNEKDINNLKSPEKENEIENNKIEMYV